MEEELNEKNFIPIEEKIETLNPEEKIVILQKEYIIKSVISSSSGCNLYLAACTEQDVVIKEVEQKYESFASKEYEFLTTIKSPILPEVYAFEKKETKIYIVEENVVGEQLDKLVEENKLTENDIVNIFLKLAEGIDIIHKNGWSVVSLTPDKIYIKDGQVKITFFDYVCKFDTLAENFYIPSFTPPEVLQNQKIDATSDIYLLGSLFYYCIFKKPFEGEYLLSLPQEKILAGIPQILFRTLVPKEYRFQSIEEFVQQLNVFKQEIDKITTIVYSYSSIGLNEKRTINEDSYGYLSLHFGSNEVSIYCVADGIGGAEAGEVASKLAVKFTIENFLKKVYEILTSTPEKQSVITKEIVLSVNQTIYDIIKKNPQLKTMGTTLLVAVRTNKYLTLGYAGDCRAYLVRDNTIKLLTEDHSLVMYLYKSGQIKKEEIRTHPDRNKILRSIGATTNLVVDGLEKVLNEPVLELTDGDIIILCTDGVWGKIEDEEILNTVLSKEIEDPAYALVEKANNYGGEDNSTVVVVKVVKRG